MSRGRPVSIGRGADVTIRPLGYEEGSAVDIVVVTDHSPAVDPDCIVYIYLVAQLIYSFPATQRVLQRAWPGHEAHHP